MNTLIILAFIIGATLVIGLGLFFFIRWKSRGDKVDFLLHTRDMRSASKLTARVKINEKGIQQYFFKKHRTRLSLQPPTRYIDNKPVRDITYDKKGDLTYVESFGMDEKDNIKIVLSHEEKIVTLNRLEENQNRYNSSINKFQAMTIIAVVVLLLVGCITAGYGGYNLYQVTKKINENSKEMLDIAKTNQATASALKDISIQQTSILAVLNNNQNITRQIS